MRSDFIENKVSDGPNNALHPTATALVVLRAVILHPDLLWFAHVQPRSSWLWVSLSRCHLGVEATGGGGGGGEPPYKNNSKLTHSHEGAGYVGKPKEVRMQNNHLAVDWSLQLAIFSPSQKPCSL